MNKTSLNCPICCGIKQDGSKTFTAELGFGIVVVRNVPAKECLRCGADWIDDKTAAEIEKIVHEAKTQRLQVAVTALS